jgi:hypothetical protein
MGAMKPFQLLVTIIASLLIITFLLTILNDDVLKKETVYEPASSLSIRDVDVKPVEVTSAKIRLNVTAYINHGGGKTRNASMLIRAVSSDTGLLETQVSAQIPEISATAQLTKTIPFSQELTVDRNGGYELKLLIFDNGSIRDSGSVNVKGLGALTPMSKRSGIIFNNIDFTVSGTKDGNVDVRSDIYLENKGSEPSENLEMIIKAREGTSNLLADKTTSGTGVIASETTAVKSVKLTVPDSYNYLVVVELWQGNVLVNTWEKPVLLAPTKTVPTGSVEKKVNIDVSKFVREESGSYPPDRPSEARAEYGEPKAPGFGSLTAIMAIAVVLFVFRRRM